MRTLFLILMLAFVAASVFLSATTSTAEETNIVRIEENIVTVSPPPLWEWEIPEGVSAACAETAVESGTAECTTTRDIAIRYRFYAPTIRDRERQTTHVVFTEEDGFITSMKTEVVSEPYDFTLWLFTLAPALFLLLSIVSFPPSEKQNEWFYSSHPLASGLYIATFLSVALVPYVADYSGGGAFVTGIIWIVLMVLAKWWLFWRGRTKIGVVMIPAVILVVIAGLIFCAEIADYGSVAAHYAGFLGIVWLCVVGIRAVGARVLNRPEPEEVAD